MYRANIWTVDGGVVIAAITRGTYSDCVLECTRLVQRLGYKIGDSIEKIGGF